MYETRNDLPLATRVRAIDLLNARLGDGVDLMLQAKQAHWNVRGPSFRSLHELFDEAAEQVGGFVDAMAERAVQLGGRAEGTVRIAAVRSTIAEYPLDIAMGAEHVDALSGAIATFGKLVRAAIDDAASLGDADTADLLTEISRANDKLLWMLEVQLPERQALNGKGPRINQRRTGSAS